MKRLLVFLLFLPLVATAQISGGNGPYPTGSGGATNGIQQLNGGGTNTTLYGVTIVSGNGSGLTNIALPLANEYVDYLVGTVNGARNGAPFNNLSNALLVALPYDRIVVGPGTGIVSVAQLPVGVHIYGSGKSKTWFFMVTNTAFNLPGGVNAHGFLLTNDNALFNMAIYDTNGDVATTPGRFPIITVGVTNLLIEDCLIHGATDIIINEAQSNQGNTNILFDNCLLEHAWDSLAHGGANTGEGTNDSIVFRNCSFFGRTNMLNVSTKRQALNNNWIGSVTWQNCNFDYDNFGTFLDNVQGVGCTFQIINCTWKATKQLFPWVWTFGNSTNATVNIVGALNSTLVTNVPASAGGGGLVETWYNLSYFTQTNFISGQFYTNTSGQNQILRATIALQTSTTAGLSQMFIMAGPSTTTLTTNAVVGLIDNAGQQSGNQFFDISCVVTNGFVYTFTNLSTGAGNIAAIYSGTGQILTIP